MSLKKRLSAITVLVLLLGIVFAIAISGKELQNQNNQNGEAPLVVNGKETLYIWYTDDALTPYISGAAVTYSENHDVRIVPVLESGLEYLENINKMSVEINSPDLYVVSHDSLEKAYLAGLAAPVNPGEGTDMETLYMGTGLQAVSYKDKLIGYPFYFETSCLLYNKTYLEDMAKKRIEAEEDVAQALAAEEALEENGPEGQAAQEADTAGNGTEETASESGGGQDEGMPDLPVDNGAAEAEEELTEAQKLAIETRMKQMLPATIENIKTLADEYDAPEQVESIFRWDVTDIFYNYFFVGDTINMGGEAGWDVEQIDIYNEDAIASLRAYEELHQFFSIDTSEIDYDKVLEEFMTGKIIFTVVTTDAVAKLEAAKEDGSFVYDYGVLQTPHINDEIKSRSLSVTGCVAVNGYGQNQEIANDFARFLTSEYNDILYDRTGKVSAAKGVDYGSEALSVFAGEYENSISMPKMIETSNFWVQLEVAFSQIWDGADANKKLKELSEQIMQQITGREFTEEYIREVQKKEEPEEEN
ncbi:MAG: extracellular solute-binding protein [Lachnospiraceae bacterium]|nr:extracellular solute-binding protein [Lachnospiraceae bacterium]